MNRNSGAWKSLRRARLAEAAANSEPCWRCGKPIDYTLPYRDPLTGLVNNGYPQAGHVHDVQLTGVELVPVDQLRPEHRGCSNRSGARSGNRRRRAVSLSGSRSGPAPDSRSLPNIGNRSHQGVGWVAPVAVGSFPDWFPPPPDDQVLPRLLTAPHPRAVGSYGPEQLAWAAERFGMHPKRTEAHRYWQTLLACVALQHDDAGDLVFSTAQLGTSRQSGKSWSMRELSTWRLEQGERFGELQTVVHAAAKLSQAEAVWAPAARWAAKQRVAHRGGPALQAGLFDLPAAAAQAVGAKVYEVRRANGSAMIVRLEDHSAWIPQAAGDQLGVSLSVSMGLVDEAWDVPRDHVDNGLVPTMAEARSSQLWIVSTAGRPKTGDVSDLYPTYRAMGREQLADPVDHLLVEWSADPDADPGDPQTWRQASPHWSEQRARVLAREWSKAQLSAASLAAFRMQWLNIWPDLQDVARWLPSRLTTAAAQLVGEPPTHAVCAIESAFSDAARFAVALAWPAGEGVAARVHQVNTLGEALELVGDDRRLWAHSTVAETIGPRRWGVDHVTVPQARAATNVLKDLTRSGALAVAGIPDEQWAAVRTTAADGGEIIDGRKSAGDVHGVKALAWAVWAVHSGRNQSGFLFGAPPDEAQPGALTA